MYEGTNKMPGNGAPKVSTGLSDLLVASMGLAPPARKSGSLSLGLLGVGIDVLLCRVVEGDT